MIGHNKASPQTIQLMEKLYLGKFIPGISLALPSPFSRPSFALLSFFLRSTLALPIVLAYSKSMVEYANTMPRVYQQYA